MTRERKEENENICTGIFEPVGVCNNRAYTEKEKEVCE